MNRYSLIVAVVCLVLGFSTPFGTVWAQSSEADRTVLRVKVSHPPAPDADIRVGLYTSLDNWLDDYLELSRFHLALNQDFLDEHFDDLGVSSAPLTPRASKCSSRGGSSSMSTATTLV